VSAMHLRTAFVLSVCLIVVGFPLPARAQGVYAAPRGCCTVRIGEEIYAKGEVYLHAHADTAALVPLGFRDFEFRGWCMSRIRYAALVPVTWPGDILPDVASGISFETPDPPPFRPRVQESEVDDYSSGSQVYLRSYGRHNRGSGFPAASPFGCVSRFG
jgi:hypothetical protein